MKKYPKKRNPIARVVKTIRPQVIPNKKKTNRKLNKKDILKDNNQ
jgi:hypothetical protein